MQPGRISRLGTIAEFGFKRIKRRWVMLLLVGVGVFLAVLLLSALAIYVQSLSELGLAHTVQSKSPDFLDTQVLVQNRSIDRRDYEKLHATVKGEADSTIGNLVVGETRNGKTPDFYLRMTQSEGVRAQTTRSHFVFFTDFDSHVQIREGRLYQDTIATSRSGARVVEAVIGKPAAQDLGLRVGDRLILSPYASDLSHNIEVTIVGTVEPKDWNEEYWLGFTFFFLSASDPDQEYRVLPLFIPEDTFFNAVGKQFPALMANYWWFFYLNGSRITTSNLREVDDAITILEPNLNRILPRTWVFTGLNRTLSEYHLKLFFFQVPLYLLVSLIVAVILYYIVLTSSLVIQHQAQDIALLKSRGASTVQVLALLASEGALLALAASLIAPLAALPLIAVLGWTPALLSLTHGSILPVGLSGKVLLMALLGSFLSFLAFLLPALRTSRQGVASMRTAQARPSSTPFFFRYYLDVIVLLLVASLYWQLSHQGSFVVERLFGGLSTNLLMLLTPALFMIGATLLFLRLFPWVLRALAWVLESVLGTAASLGLKHLSREPLWYSGLAVLLMLATGLGMFASSFGSTLKRSYEDRAAYATGADFRVGRIPAYLSGDREELVKRASSVHGIKTASPVLRTQGVMGNSSYGPPYTMLAVDPRSFEQVAWYRQDFSQRPLRDMMLNLWGTGTGGPAKASAQKPAKLGLWVASEKGYPGLALWVRLRDKNGSFSSIQMGRLDFTGWKYLETTLDSLPKDSFALPLTVSSVYLVWLERGVSPASGVLYLDNMTVANEDGSKEVLDDFEGPPRWRTFYNPTSFQDTFDTTKDTRVGGQSAGLYRWQTPISRVPRGLFTREIELPIPILAGRTFVARSGVPLGQEFVLTLGNALVPVKVISVVDYFPTLDPGFDAFAIANLDHLTGYLELLPAARVPPANEIWAAARTGESSEAAVSQALREAFGPFAQVNSKEETSGSFKKDPLVGAGWDGMLALAHTALMVIGAGGFTIVSYFSFQRERSRMAVLSSLGLSRQQRLVLTYLQHLLPVLFGFLMGLLVGSQINRLLVQFLNISEEATSVLPRLQPMLNWLQSSIFYLSLAVVVVVATAVLWWRLRGSSPQVLRFE